MVSKDDAKNNPEYPEISLREEIHNHISAIADATKKVIGSLKEVANSLKDRYAPEFNARTVTYSMALYLLALLPISIFLGSHHHAILMQIVSGWGAVVFAYSVARPATGLWLQRGTRLVLINLAGIMAVSTVLVVLNLQLSYQGVAPQQWGTFWGTVVGLSFPIGFLWVIGKLIYRVVSLFDHRRPVDRKATSPGPDSYRPTVQDLDQEVIRNTTWIA